MTLSILGYSNLKLNRDRNARTMVDVNDPDDEPMILTGDDLEVIQWVKSKHANELEKLLQGSPRYLDVTKVVKMAKQVAKMAEHVEEDSIKDADKTFGKYRGPDGVARLKTAEELVKQYIQVKIWNSIHLKKEDEPAMCMDQ
ncbi:hypothetical protein BG000_002119 [Podila horticola]|nr:hypothetical protein BG000_002119 [Podila horticola]